MMEKMTCKNCKLQNPGNDFIDCVLSASEVWDKLDDIMALLIGCYDNASKEGKRIISDCESIRNAMAKLRENYDNAVFSPVTDTLITEPRQ